MTVLARRFYAHEKGNHDEDFFSVGRDDADNSVFIIHDWYHRADMGSRRMTVPEFVAYARGSSRLDRFIALIGTLATEPEK